MSQIESLSQIEEKLNNLSLTAKNNIEKANTYEELDQLRVSLLGKKGDLASRKKAYSILPEKQWTSKIFDELSERYKERDGGYTRVLKAGFRYGDSAPMAVIELVDRNPDALGQDSGPVLSEEIEEVS